MGRIIGVIKGHARSLDYGLNGSSQAPPELHGHINMSLLSALVEIGMIFRNSLNLNPKS